MSVYQGTYYECTFIIQDSDGVAINLTGYTFEADVRTAVASTTTLFTLTSGAGIDIVSPLDGTLKVSMTAGQTVLCPIGSVVFDVHHLNATPGPTFLFRGTVKVRQSVTR